MLRITESWADLWRDCRSRGMTAPVLAVGDGAPGFWKVVREVFPATREQRSWFHKQANVLAGLCQRQVGIDPLRRIEIDPLEAWRVR
jgi:transposase-like protein